jgi:hypothetical protein
MHFVSYPRHELGCPHVGHSPHLGGAPLSLLYLQYDIGLTTRKVVRTITGLARFASVPGSLLRFGREAGRKAQPLAQDVPEKILGIPRRIVA